MNTPAIKSKKLKARYRLIIGKLGYNPLDYGFSFDYFVNGRSITFTKKLSDRSIIICVNYWFNKSYLSIYRDTYCTELFDFKNNNIPNKRSFERVLKVCELYKRRGVPGYWSRNERGKLSFKYDEKYK